MLNSESSDKKVAGEIQIKRRSYRSMVHLKPIQRTVAGTISRNEAMA
jgi:hypothetical protein